MIALVGPLACTGLVAAARRATTADRLRGDGDPAPWRISKRLRPRLARALEDADIEREPEAAIELWGIGVLAVVIVTLAVSPVMVVVTGPAVIVAGPVGLWLLRARRDQRFAVELPSALEHVAAELRGGGTVISALARLGAAPGAVATDLRRVQARTQLGLSLVDSLERWPTEHDAPGVRAAAGAFAVAASLGGSAADAIDGLATSLRHRRDAAAEARALSSQARLSAVVVGAAPVGYLVFSSVVDPASVGVLTGTGVGRVCLVIGVALECVAALWIRRIVGSES